MSYNNLLGSTKKIKKPWGWSLLLLCLLFPVYADAQETQESIGVYVSPPGILEFDLEEGYTPTVEGFGELTPGNDQWAVPHYESTIGLYEQSGTSNIVADD